MIVLALLAASFLNAQGLRKTAHIQPPGRERNVAVWLTSRLADASHFLYLDRPRHELKSAIGRAGDDVIDTRVVLGPIPRQSPPPVTKKPPPHAPKQRRPPPRKEAYTASHPLRVWVAGDSLAEVPGQSLERITGEGASIDVLAVESRLATGLTRPDVYNWFTRLRQAVPRLRPRVAVLSFGADDSHNYMTGLPGGRTVGPNRQRELGRRVPPTCAGVMRESNAAGVYVVWLGVPDLPQPRPQRPLPLHRPHSLVGRPHRPAGGRLYRHVLAVRGRGRVPRLPARPGWPARPGAGRRRRPLHPPGGDLIANAVIARLGRTFDLVGRPSG